jgi:peptidyl-prolyl cis-trans isomerase D
MIRFLQKDSRVVKAFFVVIIGAASVSMVVYLIPGLTGQSAVAADTYAVVYPHWYSRYLSSGETVSMQRVEQLARQQLSQQRYPDNPMILNLFEQRVGQQLVQEQILLSEAAKLGVTATDGDVITFLHQGAFGEYLFPKGDFIGEDKYTDFVASRFNMSVAQFEDEIKREIVLNRLRSLITAPVTVSDQDVRDSYRKDNIKIKFDYAILATRTSRHSSRRTPRVTLTACRKSGRSPILLSLPINFPAECRSHRSRRSSSTSTRTSRNTRFPSRPNHGTFSSRCPTAPMPRPMPRPRPRPKGF